MSAFTVFAVTRASARTEANARSRQKIGETPQLLSVRRCVLAEQFFREGTARKEQVAPLFDAPQFARDWIACAHGAEGFTAPEVFAFDAGGALGGALEAAGRLGQTSSCRWTRAFHA